MVVDANKAKNNTVWIFDASEQYIEELKDTIERVDKRTKEVALEELYHSLYYVQ